MGTGYEYLVGKFADDAGHTAQEFYTNRTVVALMAEILKPQPGESIYDPTCGSGGMLIKCLTSLKDQHKEWRGVRVYGQELNALTAAIARMNLFCMVWKSLPSLMPTHWRNPPSSKWTTPAIRHSFG